MKFKNSNKYFFCRPKLELELILFEIKKLTLIGGYGVYKLFCHWR